MNITIIGTGYVGLSNAMLFSEKHHIKALDIDVDKIACLNAKTSPIQDDLIQEYLIKAPDFHATTDPNIAYNAADIIIIATPVLV